LQGRNAGWYLIDFARGRPTNPACTPVGASAAWYHIAADGRDGGIFPDLLDPVATTGVAADHFENDHYIGPELFGVGEPSCR
jgi:hypothetical protein